MDETYEFSTDNVVPVGKFWSETLTEGIKTINNEKKRK